MDPWIIPRFVLLCVRAGVKRFGWKTVIVGWVLSGIAAVVLQLST